MKLVVVIPSLDYKANAGARIRYGRLVKGLAARDISFTMEPISSFDPAKIECDAVVFSKCHDARAPICAHVLSQRDIPVGVDVFDDYFSQSADSRLNRLRSWLSEMLGECTFALASTPATADLVLRYAPSLPVHILNDPAPAFDEAQLAQRLHDKRSEAIASGRLKIAWFGMGDNPHFAVGLRDLSAFAPALSSLSAGPFAVELAILTNRRSLDAAGLERITSLPVSVTVEIWSEEREASLLDESLVAFLPVNANRFSRAKSMNRAVTALAAGCQLLSAGYPLYAPLAPLVYRDSNELLGHLAGDALRLSPATLELMRERFDCLASAEREIDRLLPFLAQLGERPGVPAQARETICLVHGMETNVAGHDLVESVGGLSVASPFCTAPFEFDAIVETRSDGDLVLLVASKALRRLAPAARKTGSKPVRIKGRKYWEVSSPPRTTQDLPPPHEGPMPLQLALYPSVMDRVRHLLIQFFDADRTVTSELSVLPFEQPGAAHA